MRGVWEGWEVPPGLRLLLASAGAYETSWMLGKHWTSEMAA